jgi:hypothetical protein
MKKLTTETVVAAKGSSNLVSLRRSPLPSSPLSATLLSTPKKSSLQSPLVFEITRKGGKKIQFPYVGAAE